MERCAEISKRLGEAVHKICKGSGDVDIFEDILADFVDAADFVDYFRATWCPRLGLWIKALKTFPLASQEASVAIEFYHNQMRARLMNEKDAVAYQRADWLIDKLGTKVHSYFWLDEYSGKDDFARYWKDEWLSGLTAWRKSLKIPDSDIVLEGNCAKVIDQDNRDTIHVIRCPGSEFAVCDCNWAKRGNLCEHVIKIVKICRDKGTVTPSISMFQYNQALVSMLHCSPHDSLIRDHAVSLALWVQKLLNEQISHDSCGDDQMKQSVVELGLEISDGDGFEEHVCRNENMLSSDMENGSAIELNKFVGLNHLVGEKSTSNGHQSTEDTSDNSSRVLENASKDPVTTYPSSICDEGGSRIRNCPEANGLGNSNGIATAMDVDIPGLSSSLNQSTTYLYQNGA